MRDDRPWYREPETFIAVAALVVSVSAVAVGIYEAALQRRHDRAEVWPHVELGTFITPKEASLYLSNNGIGPALIKSLVVTVDGKPRSSWPDVLTEFLGHKPKAFDNTSVVEDALRPGEQVKLVSVPANELPTGFWKAVARIGVRVCFSSVFDEHWTLTEAHLGGTSVWTSVKVCPPQPKDTEF